MADFNPRAVGSRIGSLVLLRGVVSGVIRSRVRPSQLFDCDVEGSGVVAKFLGTGIGLLIAVRGVGSGNTVTSRLEGGLGGSHSGGEEALANFISFKIHVGTCTHTNNNFIQVSCSGFSVHD